METKGEGGDQDKVWLEKNQKDVVWWWGFRIREAHVGALSLQFDHTILSPRSMSSTDTTQHNILTHHIS